MPASLLLCSAFPGKSTLGNSGNRAFAGAGAAIQAGVRVDDILAVALGNRRNRAHASAGAASDAVVRNFVSHKYPSSSPRDRIFYGSVRERRGSAHAAARGCASMCSHFNIKCGFFKGRRATFTHFLHAGKQLFPARPGRRKPTRGKSVHSVISSGSGSGAMGARLPPRRYWHSSLWNVLKPVAGGSIRTRRVPEMTLVSTTAPTPSGVLTMLPTPGVILFRYSYAGCS